MTWVGTELDQTTGKEKNRKGMYNSSKQQSKLKETDLLNPTLKGVKKKITIHINTQRRLLEIMVPYYLL